MTPLWEAKRRQAKKGGFKYRILEIEQNISAQSIRVMHIHIQNFGLQIENSVVEYVEKKRTLTIKRLNNPFNTEQKTAGYIRCGISI